MIGGSADQFLIRPARASEFTELQQIEAAAGQLFRSVGMDDLADHDPTSIVDYGEVCKTGLLLVGVFDERLAGLVMAFALDGNFHIDELSVHPTFARRGLGTALIERACAEATARSYPWVTLRTFRDVPWNGPFYTRLGFREIPNDAQTPGLTALVADEVQRGLDPDLRLSMRRRP